MIRKADINDLDTITRLASLLYQTRIIRTRFKAANLRSYCVKCLDNMFNITCVICLVSTKICRLETAGHPQAMIFSECFSEASADNCACFIKCVDGKAVGFAQCGLRRDYVEGTVSSPAGYLEGIFIEKPYRRRGFAKELLKACENWAKAKGCREFASDCELTNNDSIAFHLNSGFKEANRIVCFVKKL